MEACDGNQAMAGSAHRSATAGRGGCACVWRLWAPTWAPDPEDGQAMPQAVVVPR